MNNNLISTDKWTPLDGLILEDNALSAIRTESNVLVIAGPGAGKTELLAQKACYLLQTSKCLSPRKILAISFKADAASNLKERVEKRCGYIGLERFSSMTYDAFAKMLLDHFRGSLSEQYQPDADYLIGDDISIHKAFQEAGFNNNRNLSPSRLKSYYYNQLASVELPVVDNGIKERAWIKLIKGNENIKACLTFQMINKLAEYIIRTNPYIKRALLLTYSHIFLDEFQDTTLIQYELVKTCFEDTNANITAVGDNKQRIMLWAGALETVFKDFSTDFRAEQIPLLMNHRSAPKLVELQSMMYESLNDVPKKIKCSERWNNEDGLIRLYKFPDADVEAEIISNDILQIKSTGTSLKDICILSKQKPDEYTFNIINKLHLLGIKARIETEYQDLIKEPIIVLLINTLYLTMREKCPNNWEQIINYINIAFAEQINSSYDFYLDKQKYLYILLNSCKNDLIGCESKELFEDIIKRILEFYNNERIKSIYPVYSQGNYYDITIKKLIDLLWSEYEISDYDWESALDNFMGLNSIPIMTIHKSKGLEYEVVYFIGLEDSAFWNFKNQPMEDRCAFFVALSRAKESICFTFCENRKVGYNQNQSHISINEFYDLLENSEIVDVIDYC